MKKKDKFHKTFPLYTNIKRHSNISYMTKNKNHKIFLNHPQIHNQVSQQYNG